ncbi:heterokaryon incompatibility protein-domain-containing protein [Hyaloscypha finlandica]|nr:heterokaryon incompatibility protein-domain-containing protein [Hyaloscypha finlandica]
MYFHTTTSQHRHDYREYSSSHRSRSMANNKSRHRIADLAGMLYPNKTDHLGTKGLSASLKIATDEHPNGSPRHAETKPVPIDFDLLRKLLPNYGNHGISEPGLCAISLYDDLPGEDWIRLLIIEPKSTSKMQYHLRAIRLNDVFGRYDALSYCWGDTWKSDYVTAMCNGHPIKLGKNLALALQHMQFRTLPRIIWVDALCINQEDIQERSSQVRLMGHIYGRASRTIIFLGNIKRNDSIAAFDIICRLVNEWDKSKSAFFCKEERGRLGKGRWVRQQPCGTASFSHLDFQKLIPIFRAKWFERRWVIQEAVLSPNVEVLVPGAKIYWRWIGIIAAILRSNFDYDMSILSRRGNSNIQTNVYNAYLMGRLSNHTGLIPVRVSLLHLLRLTSGFKTTKEVDVVFGLLGLSCKDHGSLEPFLVVDYNLSHGEVMRGVAEKLMMLPEPLAFLSDAVGAWRIPTSDIPSWTPDWSVKNYSMLDPWSLDQEKSAFNPARGLSFKRWSSNDRMSLVLDGICVSDILWVGSSFSGDMLTAMKEIFHITQNFAVGIGPWEVMDIISRTMTGGRDASGNSAQHRSEYANDFVAFLREWHNCYDGPLPMLHEDIREVTSYSGTKYTQFVEVARIVCGRRTLFLTSHGHIGLGPETMSKGDVVCVLGGATMIHILRKTGDDFVLVGDCFIDGLMNGEAVTAMQTGLAHIGPLMLTEKFLDTLTLLRLPKHSADYRQLENYTNRVSETLQLLYPILERHIFDGPNSQRDIPLRTNSFELPLKTSQIRIY